MDDEFLRHAAGELLRFGEEDPLELVHVLEGASVGHGEAGVHGFAPGVVTDVGAGDVHHLVLGAVRDGAVGRAPAAGDVVVLEREAGRVEPGMAAGAGGLVAVLVELLADRRRAPDVGLDGGHVLGRRVRRRAEEAVEHVGAADHGRGARAVRGDFQDGPLGEEAAPAGVGTERDLAELVPLHAGDAVVFGKTLVEHREVGMDHVADAQVPGEHRLEVGMGLRHHRLLEVLLELRVELGVGLGEVDVPQVQPAAEQVLGEAFRLG